MITDWGEPARSMRTPTFAKAIKGLKRADDVAQEVLVIYLNNGSKNEALVECLLMARGEICAAIEMLEDAKEIIGEDRGQLVWWRRLYLWLKRK